jgi:hypothetical protein
MTEQTNPQKSISKELSDLLKKLSVDQVRYVIARMDYPTKGEAAQAIGIKPDTAYRWNGDVERAVELMAMDALESAKVVRRRNLLKAVAVKVKGLDSRDESLRQKVASEIIEWELGKAGASLELTGRDGAPLSWKVFIGEDAKTDSE